MRVSARHALIISAACLTASFAAPANAVIGGGGGNACCNPAPPPPPSCCNHGGGHTVNVPNIHVNGPNINVGVNVHSSVNVTANVNATVNASANANAMAGARSNAGATVYVGGGGYANYSSAPAATAITGLNVVGVEEEEYEYYEEERSRIVEEWRVIRAICVDDSGSPHPASQVDGEERIDGTYDGEVYRCMAGTAMQVMIGWRVDGENVWEDAATIACRKGEALRHTPGGMLSCVTQEPRRNCNERSLLRRYGPGEKLIFLRREERYTEEMRREARYERRETTRMTLMLDGGVGGYR